MSTQADLMSTAYTAGYMAAGLGDDRSHPYSDVGRDSDSMARAVLMAREWNRGYDEAKSRQDLAGFRSAWYEISNLFDIPAMATSPAQVHESVLMPKIRWLLERNAELQKALKAAVEWAEPMSEAPISSRPAWFDQARTALSERAK